MGLEGSLSDFRITEIIQLIGQQFKTGVLHAESGRKVVEVFFLDGLIVHVLPNYRSKRDLLGEILLKARKITQEDLERVLKRQDETLQYSGEIMVELKILSEDEIVRVISTQVYETIYDLLSWKEGNFRFEPRAVESYKKISIALSPEHVLLNVLRMIDEWPAIEEKLSSIHVVFQKVKPLPRDIKEKSPEKQLIYELTDGRLSLEEIIDRSLLGRFNACEAMVELWNQDCVERVSVRKPGLTKLMGARVGLRSLAIAPKLLSYAMIAVITIILILFLKPLILSGGKMGKERLPFSQSFLHDVACDEIRSALTAYYLENGEYPESIESLTHVGLITTRDLALCKGLRLGYSRGKKGGYVFEAGPP